MLDGEFILIKSPVFVSIYVGSNAYSSGYFKKVSGDWEPFSYDITDASLKYDSICVNAATSLSGTFPELAYDITGGAR